MKIVPLFQKVGYLWLAKEIERQEKMLLGSLGTDDEYVRWRTIVKTYQDFGWTEYEFHNETLKLINNGWDIKPPVGPTHRNVVPIFGQKIKMAA